MTRLPRLEPGVLPILRLFMAGEWVVLGLMLWLAASQGPPQSDALTAVGWGSASVVLASLAWGRVQRGLGRWYLPLVLGLLTLGPVIALPASVAWRMSHGLSGQAAQVDAGVLLPWLLLPLVLLSTHYGVRVVLAFASGTSLLTSGAAVVLAAHGGPSAAVTLQDAVTRAILFAVVGSLIALLSRAQRSQRELMARQAITLEQLAISRERNRLARELHDTLAHTLSAVSVQLAALNAAWEVDHDGAHQRAQQAYDLTRTGLDEVRRALHALRASPIEALGLSLALQRLAAEAASRADLALTCTLPAPLPAVPFAVEQQCYRIIEEALNNVVRHAHARQLRVACHPTGRGLSFEVADDGQGFVVAAEPPPGHFGLIGMRERALLIGGALTVTSRPGHGTTIQLIWPGERTTS